MASEPPKVFISYNRADRDWAEWIAGVIEQGGYQPIIQAWHFRPGEDFVLQMQQASTESLGMHLTPPGTKSSGL
jgi:hypothetical protein